MNFKQVALTVTFFFGGMALLSVPMRAATAAELQHDAVYALHALYQKSAKACECGNNATAVLVFPTIVKAGFIFGAQGGEGVLIGANGRILGYYHSTAVSYGLQAGVQKYGYVLFFMNHSALSYLKKSDGWEVGVGPSIVVVDTGAARSMSTTTMQKDIYAFIFSQEGLMAGLGLQGAKITPYTPDK